MPKPDAKPSLCITCHAPVQWIDDREAGHWRVVDPATKKPHRCKEAE